MKEKRKKIEHLVIGRVVMATTLDGNSLVKQGVIDKIYMWSISGCADLIKIVDHFGNIVHMCISVQ